MICFSKKALGIFLIFIILFVSFLTINEVNKKFLGQNIKAATKADIWPLCPINLKTGKTTKNCCDSKDVLRGYRCYLGKYSIDCKGSRTTQSVISCKCNDATGKCTTLTSGTKGSVKKIGRTPTNTPTPTKKPTITIPTPTPDPEEKLNRDFAEWFNKNGKASCFKISFPCGFTIDLNKTLSQSLHTLFEKSSKLREFYMVSVNGPIIYNYSDNRTGIWVDFDEYANRDFGNYPDWIKANAKIAWHETSDFDGYVAPIHAWPHVVGITNSGDLFYAAQDIYWELASNYPLDGTPIDLKDKYMQPKSLQISSFSDDTNRQFFYFPTKSSGVILFEVFKDDKGVTFRGFFLRMFLEFADV